MGVRRGQATTGTGTVPAMIDDEREAYIQAVVAKAPPLTAAQIATLSALFDDGVGESDPPR